jgi:hypothetical protein
MPKFKPTKFEFERELFTVAQDGTYSATGEPRYIIFDRDGVSQAVLSVVIMGAKLEPGEFLVKTWSENTSIAAAVKAANIFEDTGKRVPSGFVQAEIWKVR